MEGKGRGRGESTTFLVGFPEISLSFFALGPGFNIRIHFNLGTFSFFMSSLSHFHHQVNIFWEIKRAISRNSTSLMSYVFNNIHALNYHFKTCMLCILSTSYVAGNESENEPMGPYIQCMLFERMNSKCSLFQVFNGHRFRPDVVHVPTYCECCDQFMWHAEKILICTGCRISTHKKCHQKIAQVCSMINSSIGVSNSCRALPIYSLSTTGWKFNSVRRWKEKLFGKKFKKLYQQFSSF